MSVSVAALRELVRGLPSALLGYSGGADSAFLAVVMRQALGPDRMVAAIGRSPSYPTAQWEAARAVAARFDVPLVEIVTHELEDASYVANPTNRCFFCKTELWRRLLPEARARGFLVVCDGTNADDLREHRPGYAAGKQAGIRSPLVEVGLTKAEIRAASRELDLPTWDAPAAPCLSSRVRYGLTITPSRLKQVEESEAFLRGLGVTGDLRVRHLGDVARLEVEPQWIAWIEERRVTITAQLLSFGFTQVEIDPRGYRRGSLLEPSSP